MKKIIPMLAAALLLTACSTQTEQSTAPQPESPITWSIGPAGIETPSSAEHGPLEQDSLPTGWTQDEQGAALAAITQQAWIAGAHDDQWEDVAQHYLEPGVGRDQWAQARALISIEGTVDNPPKFVGYKIDSFDKDHTIVVIAAKYPDGNTYGYPAQMSHATGQWRTVMPEQGQEPDLIELTEEELNQFHLFTENGEENA